jgi:DNA-directed RNA polymerase subunit RPC12/RpoP
MPIPFSCQQCGRNLRVKDELAGMQIYCPDCKGVLVVPRSDESFRAEIDSPFEVQPAELPNDDPYADRLQDVLPAKPPPVPEAEEFDDDPPPRRIAPTRSFGKNYGAVFGGGALVALSIIIAVACVSINVVPPIRLCIVLFIAGIVTFCKGLFSSD